jgi:hypothetical protein
MNVRFVADLVCTVHGTDVPSILRSKVITVGDVLSVQEAEDYVKAVAFEMVADQGGNWLDGNLVDIELRGLRRVR